MLYLKDFVRIIIVVFLTLLLSNGCKQSTNQIIPPHSPLLKYEGRIDTSAQNVAGFFWPGTTVRLKFEGTSVQAIMNDTKGESFYNVIIDGKPQGYIRPDTTKKAIELAELSHGVHTVELFRRTEFTTGTTNFYGFKIGRNAEVLPQQKHKHKFAFYGNSVTAGFANEDYSGQDRPDSIFTNNYMSYAAITARHYNADYHCIARGGIGFMVSWYPQIMPELYNRLNPNNSQIPWGFYDADANLVVVNLGQNDFWIIENHKMEAYQYQFGDSVIQSNDIVIHYKAFIQKLRSHYPASPIICTLGSMAAVAPGSPWPGYIRKAVQALNDENVYVHFFEYLAKNGHPRVEDHQKMAKSLIQFIEKHNLLKDR